MKHFKALTGFQVSIKAIKGAKTATATVDFAAWVTPLVAEQLANSAGEDPTLQEIANAAVAKLKEQYGGTKDAEDEGALPGRGTWPHDELAREAFAGDMAQKEQKSVLECKTLALSARAAKLRGA